MSVTLDTYYHNTSMKRHMVKPERKTSQEMVDYRLDSVNGSHGETIESLVLIILIIPLSTVVVLYSISTRQNIYGFCLDHHIRLGLLTITHLWIRHLVSLSRHYPTLIQELLRHQSKEEVVNIRIYDHHNYLFKLLSYYYYYYYIIYYYYYYPHYIYNIG